MLGFELDLFNAEARLFGQCVQLATLLKVGGTLEVVGLTRVIELKL